LGGVRFEIRDNVVGLKSHIMYFCFAQSVVGGGARFARYQSMRLINVQKLHERGLPAHSSGHVSSYSFAC
jgi:hypothetical protein